jgi:hypothetical protein
MSIFDNPIIIETEATAECFDGGNAVPIKVNLPYTPYDKIIVTVETDTNSELSQGLALDTYK